ncbi:MAG: M15 family metallopeptidase [Lachnospiraceae bacterium]|nr:M15 family metallopeptidase [Lachnospiraceae bacterium]
MIDSAKHPYKPSVRDAAAGFCILVIAGTAAFAAGSPDPEPAPAESAAEDKTAAVTAGTPSAFSEMAQKSTIVAQVMPAASENAPTVSKAGERLAAGGKDETPLEEQIEIDQILQEEEQLEEAPAELEPYERLGMSLDDWNLILVNKEHLIPEDYEFELVDTDDWQRIDERVADDLEEMLQDCRDEGYVPIVCSGYRPIDKQERLFEADVRKFERQGYSEDEAIELTAESVAIPGTSEHEIGLAADIVSEGNQRLDDEQEDTETQQWLMENCWRYGFILRYPRDKEDLTGIGYEPWHYRYVGYEAAEYIWEHDLCLEEFLGITEPIGDYEKAEEEYEEEAENE